VSGRIRTIKPEWLEDELMALASDAARVLSIALLLQADDYGNGRANPVQLAGKVFPGKALEHTASALEELRSMTFVGLYEVDGQRYFHIRNWAKHQRVDKPGAPRVPGPPSVSPQNDSASAPTETSREVPAKVPEVPANLLASRASDRGPDPDPDRGPDPGPGQRRDIRALASAYLRDEFTGSNGGIGGGVANSWPEVLAVCSAFAGAWRKPVTLRTTGLKDPRLKVILERFAEGFTVEQLEQAIERARFADYIANNQANQTLQTILRDAGQVEKFAALTGPPTVPKPQLRRGEASPDEERRTTRNNLLDDAKAGRYGAKAKAWAESGKNLRGLADKLEQKRDEPAPAVLQLVGGIGRS
jgi:hypothetical protein